jgi:hypothetical protein
MEYHKINALYNRWRKEFDPLETLPVGKKFGDFKDGEFACEEFEYLFHNQWVWSEKLDGTNIRIYADWSENLEKHIYTVKGKDVNSVIPKDLMDWVWKWIETNQKSIHKTLPNKDVVLYGEGIGKGIQKVGHHYGQQHFKLFDVYINGFWLKKEAVKDIASKINLDTVTTWTGTIQDAIDKVKTLPKSTFGDFTLEGYVGEPLVRLLDAHHKRIITKIKVCDFMPKQKKGR